jgi:alpha-amylase
MGFTAIWISPVTEQLSGDTGDGEAYHGYWQQKMWVACTVSSRWAMLFMTTTRYHLNSNFGTANDLKDLASALHNRGMYLMVDVVANHMVC